MNRLAGILLAVACVAAAAFGLYLSAANRELIALDLLFWPAISLRSGMALVLAFAAGGLCGLLAGLLARNARGS